MVQLSSYYAVFAKCFAKLGSAISAKVYSCDLCGLTTIHTPLLCQYCYQDLTRYSYSQLQGDLLNQPSVHKALPKVAFDHLVCVAPYSWPMSNWITQLKYHHRFEISQLLAKLLADSVSMAKITDSKSQFSLIIPIPLHHLRQRKRQYNQADLIGRELAKRLNITYRNNIVKRIVSTKAQVGMTGSQRRKNLKNVFELSMDKLEEFPSHVAIVDDVVTTGSTASAVAKLLKKHGVEKVTVLAVALAN